jgi:predicted transcriptional regulator of viral defense system
VPHHTDFLDRLQAEGRFTFTLGEAMASLDRSRIATAATLRRLAKQEALAMPFRGFFVVVPPEYRRLQCLPPEQFVPQLMQHLGLQYHAALLTAAELHGAAHHRPQAFQVMLARRRPPLQCGQVRVQYFARKDIARTPIVGRNTPRGVLQVSSPEATALELVGYAESCGGLDVVASVLDELAPVLDPERLAAAARGTAIAWSQRLGYLLERAGQTAAATVLAHHVAEAEPHFTALVNRKSRSGPRTNRWRLIVNADVEVES